MYYILYTLNSAYNKVTFNKKSAIMEENLHNKYTPFTYNDITLNKKPPITKQNLCIFFFHYRQSWVYITQHNFIYTLCSKDNVYYVG